MFRTMTAAALAAGMAFTGHASAQGFSAGGAAGVAAMQGATASPGYSGGSAGGRETDGAVAILRRGPVGAHRRVAPTDIDLPPMDGGPGAALPPR